jgi:hypothetical protein
MGKKSRRKAPKAQRERKELVPASDYRADHLVRYRQPGYYDVDARAFNLLCAHENYMVEMHEDDLKTAEEERDKLGEFIHLVLFPTHKKEGLEAALRLVKRWPKFKSHWHRVRRRICDYCGRRNDLSEPRLWVCAGCGVARYCDEACQAGDFLHHEKCCPVLARQWDGVGSIPTSLLDPIVVRQWKDPSVIPNARARERLTTELAGILGRARQLGMTIGGK